MQSSNNSPAQDVPQRFSAAAVTALINDAMVASGLPAGDARIVAELMTEADLTGADSHGIFRLPEYATRIASGGINAKPAIAVERKAPGVALVDGDNGMGHLVMAKAAETAIALAAETGVGWVGARRSNHAGAAAAYVEMAVKKGMVGIYSAVAGGNHMALWGGSQPALGTNPIAVGIPCGIEPPVILDIATTVASYGTVKNYALQNKTMPEGWLISRKDGTPVTDPKRKDESLLLPIGGYKGSGLALVLGILAGTLNGAAFGPDLNELDARASNEANTGHFILALDVARFMPVEMFAAMLAPQLEQMRSGPALPDAGSIRLPGDQRAVRRTERLAAGVLLPTPLVRQLNDLSAGMGITPIGERR